jgi:4-amino-4-deoxy-L-arabinose transferase-like glycosyltransferase
VGASAARRVPSPPRAALAAAAVVVRAAPEPAVLAVAAALRLTDLSRVATDPYYDAAVRSMGTSWPAFLAGAFEPGRRVAIDKPAPGVWLQVLSTRLLGVDRVALLLPAALAGVATVAALIWLVRSIAGRRAALVAGAALAVLPAAVVTARSDTMDSLMAALAVIAAALAVRAARGGRPAALAAAGALSGLAFEVKLVEALVPVAAVALVWLAGARRRRALGAAVWTGAFAAVALAWLVAVTLVPLHPRPWALGSADGSPWSAALVYDGLDRLLPSVGPPGAVPAARTPAGRARRSARERAAAAARAAPPGSLRLLSARRHLDTWFGLEAVAALAALAAALALGVAHGWPPWGGPHGRAAEGRSLWGPHGGAAEGWFLGGGTHDRAARAGVLALVAWLVAGLALCSAMADLRPRYLELVDPAVAGVLGIGVARLARGGFTAATIAALVLAVPLGASLAAVRGGAQDSGDAGALPAARVAALSDFLARHPGGLAAAAPGAVAPLIARDGRPVLVLSDGRGRELVTPRALARSGVRYAVLGPRCAPGDGGESGCLPVVRWARSHARAVSVGGGPLYVLTPACAPEARGRTPTSTSSRRTARVAARCGRRPASRGARRRASGARRPSAARSRST